MEKFLVVLFIVLFSAGIVYLGEIWISKDQSSFSYANKSLDKIEKEKDSKSICPLKSMKDFCFSCHSISKEVK